VYRAVLLLTKVSSRARAWDEILSLRTPRVHPRPVRPGHGYTRETRVYPMFTFRSYWLKHCSTDGHMSIDSRSPKPFSFKSRAGNLRFMGTQTGPCLPKTNGKGWGASPPILSRLFLGGRRGPLDLQQSAISGPTLTNKGFWTSRMKASLLGGPQSAMDVRYTRRRFRRFRGGARADSGGVR
jgi:hypothetical protein